MSVRIRVAMREDAARLAVLAATTFRDSYENDIGRETTEPYIQSNFDEATTLTQLLDASYTFLVAEDGPNLIGYAALYRRTAFDCVRGERPIQLRRIYVDERSHRSGVGSLLLDGVMSAARETGHDAVWLTVWQRNARAIAFYLAREFEIVGEAPFHMTGKVMRDHVLRRAISLGLPSGS